MRVSDVHRHRRRVVPLQALRYLLYPALWLLNTSSNAALRLAGLNVADRESLVHSEEELRIILAESARVGVVSGSVSGSVGRVNASWSMQRTVPSGCSAHK